jgi:hypothetical protein
MGGYGVCPLCVCLLGITLVFCRLFVAMCLMCLFVCLFFCLGVQVAKDHDEVEMFATALGSDATEAENLRIATFYESKSNWAQVRGRLPLLALPLHVWVAGRVGRWGDGEDVALFLSGERDSEVVAAGDRCWCGMVHRRSPPCGYAHSCVAF